MMHLQAINIFFKSNNVMLVYDTHCVTYVRAFFLSQYEHYVFA